MTSEELLGAAVASGADEAGIRDRFGDDADLYALCFDEFLNSPHIGALDAAMRAKDVRRAFEAAHALKGLTGNLGLAAYYERWPSWWNRSGRARRRAPKRSTRGWSGNCGR